MCKEISRTSYLQDEDVSMVENLHTQIPSINKSIERYDLYLDNRITWELPHSTQPWPKTIPILNSDPPEMDSNMQVD